MAELIRSGTGTAPVTFAEILPEITDRARTLDRDLVAVSVSPLQADERDTSVNYLRDLQTLVRFDDQYFNAKLQHKIASQANERAIDALGRSVGTSTFRGSEDTSMQSGNESMQALTTWVESGKRLRAAAADLRGRMPSYRTKLRNDQLIDDGALAAISQQDP